jgi:Uma2 family endonuclease
MTVRTAEPQTKRWTRQEYYRLAEEGYFQGKRVQLLEGEIIEMAPQGHAHAKAVSITSRLLQEAFGPDCWVREEKPLNVGRRSDPEPDVAVVAGGPDDFSDHPTTAFLVVEISDTSLALDRRKVALYAAAGVEEYWIVDLTDRRLEVYRSPERAAREYAEKRVLSENESVAPLARPQAVIKVNELLR